MTNLTANQRKNLLIVALAVLVIGFSTWVSLNPDNYFFYRPEDKQHWQHPTVHFLIVCALYVAESFFVAKTVKLGPNIRLWPRALVATLLFLPLVAFSSMFVVHAPVYLHIHIVWVWLLLAALVLGSASRHVFNAVSRQNAV